jgi:hypothetical protein
MSSISPFLHQKGMRPAPPLTRDSQSRADEGSIRSMTGGSGPISGSHTKHVVHTKLGDHREAGHHTGSANSSAVPRTQPGHPIGGGKINGIDE